jgi:uncharacterized protein Yka (UPF0111/DUF47 family)
MFNLLPRETTNFTTSWSNSQTASSIRPVNSNASLPASHFDGQLSNIERDRVEARKLFSESLLRLDQAFITPLDRDDILSLITEMYGVVDRISKLSQRFRLYKLKDLHPTLTGQAKNLSTIAEELRGIIHGLREKRKLKNLKPSLDAVSSTMELVKRDRETFLGDLFAGNPDPLDVFKKKEMHDLLEEAIERCEEATETLARVLLKNG